MDVDGCKAVVDDDVEEEEEKVVARIWAFYQQTGPR